MSKHENNGKSTSKQASHGPAGNMAAAEKPKNFKKSWGKLINYCKPYMIIMIVALICAVVGSAFTLFGPNKLSQITDIITNGLMTGIDITAIVNICAYLAIIYGIGAILGFMQDYIMATVTQRVTKNLRTSISKKINRLPLKYFDSTTYGDVLSRVTNDVDNIGQTLHQSAGQIVSAATLFLGSLLMMLITNAIMAVTAVVTTVAGFILMIAIMRISQKYFVRRQKHLGDMNGHIEEIYSGHNIVKVYNGASGAKQKFEQINDALYESNWKSQFLSGLMQPLMQFIGNFGYVAVCIVGAVLVLSGSISFGVIVAFMVYIRLFTQPLSQIAQAATSLQTTAAASERVFEFLDEKEMEDESAKDKLLENASGEVEFKNVSFGYSADKMIVKNFSINIKPGQKIAIVGPTGAGKTTLVNLLMRFYEVNSGQILIDEVPISEITRENLHNLFGMVLQDTWLFEGTIKDNVAYSKQGVSDEEIANACKAVGMDYIIRTMPQGYNTVLNDNVSLSAGERQLLTIARAMIENAPLLILDEATSSVDTRTELLVQRAMDKLVKGRTSFVIAHRLSTIKNADLILVMKDGDIIESGSHDELIEAKGFYSDLYNSQFDKNVA